MPKKKEVEPDEAREKLVKKLAKKITDKNQLEQADAIVWAIECILGGKDPDEDDENNTGDLSKNFDTGDR